MPAPHHSILYRPAAIPDTQLTVSKAKSFIHAIISHCCQKLCIYLVPFWRNSALFVISHKPRLPHVYLTLPWGDLLEFHHYLWRQKTGVPVLLCCIVCVMTHLSGLREQLVTDRWTDRPIAHTTLAQRRVVKKHMNCQEAEAKQKQVATTRKQKQCWDNYSVQVINYKYFLKKSNLLQQLITARKKHYNELLTTITALKVIIRSYSYLPILSQVNSKFSQN